MVLLFLVLVLSSCGVDNTVDVQGGTSNEATVRVEYAAEICDDDRFTAEQKLECISMLTSPEVSATVLSDGLTQEQIDELLGVGGQP
jgi:hypothetical protein